MEIILLGGLVALFLFLYPVFAAKTVNVGNGTGIVLALLLIGYAFKADQINSWLIGSDLGIMLLTLIMIVVVVVLMATFAMVGAWRLKPSGAATVIVLGCKVEGDRPSAVLTSRLKAARRYLENHPEAECILSGGKGADENITEAECMYDYLVKAGIASSRLYREDRSTSTRENLLYSLEIIIRRHLNWEIAIITSEFHQYRAGVIARKLGLKPAAVVARTPVMYFLTLYIRELYGILLEWIIRKR